MMGRALLLLLFALAAVPGARTGCAVAAVVEPQSARDAEVAAWRELLELDLHAELLRVAAPRIEPGAPRAEDGEALALVAKALFATGAEVRARKLAERAVGDERGRAALLLARARFALAEDDLDGALRLLERENALEEGALLLGRALVRRGDPRKAAPHLERFVKEAPHDVELPSALHMLAQIALDARELERAAALRERARRSAEWHAFHRTRRLQVREHPDDPLPRLGLVELWRAAGERARALELARELTARFPSFARGFAARAELERELGDLPAAGGSAAKALELDPALPEALFTRARLALAAQRHDAARADLERLLAGAAMHERRFLAAHLELARLLATLGESAAAETRHARYRELGGSEPLAPK